jgi:hypothetical protein
MKKPFKDTKVGKLLFGAKELLPENGVLGVLKNLIDSDDTLTPEEREEAHKWLIEAYKAEVSDRDSARNREIEIAKSGREDWLFNLTGIVGLGAFAFIVYVITQVNVPLQNKELFIHLIGIVEGVALSIFGYYFGTSMKESSKNKLKEIYRIIQFFFVPFRSEKNYSVRYSVIYLSF